MSPISCFCVSGLVADALSGFSVPEVVRIARLKGGLSILELFHGDTLAFKDLAMTCTVRFLSYFLRQENRRATVLVGKNIPLCRTQRSDPGEKLKYHPQVRRGTPAALPSRVPKGCRGWMWWWSTPEDASAWCKRST